MAKEVDVVVAWIELNGWDTGIKFAASHFIPGHTKCGRLHGHVYGVRVRIYGDLGENHMVMDFIELKKFLKRIAEEMDHHVLIPTLSSEMEITKKEKEGCVEVLVKTPEPKRYVFPLEDVCFVEIPQVSAEKLAEYLLRRITAETSFPPGVKKIEVGVDEGRGQGGWVSMEIKTVRGG